MLAIIGGAALAAPLPVLEVGPPGPTARTLTLDPDGTFTYAYRQSIYDVVVFEDFRHEWGRLRLERARSSSAAAVEYFRWPTEIRRHGDEFVAEAPGIVESSLTVRVAPLAGQSIRTRAGYFILLQDIGSEVVEVRGAWRPLIVWLPAHITQID